MRVAVIGLGFMGSTHLKAWKTVEHAEVVAVCSENPAKLTGDLSSIQGNLGGPGEKYDFSSMGRYTNVSELLADEKVEAVDICLPTNMHAPVAIDALRAGKHVLVEKPMALNAEDADRMIEEARKARRILMTGQVLRFLPAYRVMADEIASGKFGKVRNAVFRRRCAAPAWSKWLGDPARSGGGVFDLLIHDVDFVLHMFGNPSGVSATGYEDLPRGIDSLNASLVYPDGPNVLVTGGWHHQKAFPFSMDYTIVADGATFDYDSSKNDGAVTVYTADGESKRLELPAVDLFAAEVSYFAQCVNEGREPELCQAEDSAAAVRLTLELLEARKVPGEYREARA